MAGHIDVVDSATGWSPLGLGMPNDDQSGLGAAPEDSQGAAQEQKQPHVYMQYFRAWAGNARCRMEELRN